MEEDIRAKRVAIVKRMLMVGRLVVGFVVVGECKYVLNERHRVGLQSQTQKEGRLEEGEDVGMS
jgi:hypothetical protein